MPGMPPKKKEPPKPRKKPDEPPVEEGLPIWMATFADMVTLLLCFFVLLLSFANQDITKFRTMMGSIKDAFGIQVERKEAEFAAFSPSKYERKDMELSQENKAVLGMVLQLKSITEELELQKSLKISTDDQGVIMRVRNDFMFDPGSAKLKTGALKVLDSAIKILKNHNFNLVIRGHTNDLPVKSKIYPSNWELSSARAHAVLHYVREKFGTPPERIMAVGCGEYHPIGDNTTEMGRAKNRRVVITVGAKMKKVPVDNRPES